MNQEFAFKKTFLLSLVISLSVSALIGVIIFLFGEIGELEFRLLMTTLAIGGYSLTGLCCAALYEKKKIALVSVSGMIVSVLGFIFTFLVIWEIVDGHLESIIMDVVTFIILSISLAHASLMLLMTPKTSLVRWSLSFTLIFIAIVTLMLLYIVVFDVHKLGEFYFRLLGAFGILDVLGTLATPLLHRAYNEG